MNTQEQAESVARKLIEFFSLTRTEYRNAPDHSEMTLLAESYLTLLERNRIFKEESALKTRLIDDDTKSLLTLSTQLTSLQSENARLREALVYYADGNHCEEDDADVMKNGDGTAQWLHYGKLAREAIGDDSITSKGAGDKDEAITGWTTEVREDIVKLQPFTAEMLGAGFSCKLKEKPKKVRVVSVKGEKPLSNDNKNVLLLKDNEKEGQ